MNERVIVRRLTRLAPDPKGRRVLVPHLVGYLRVEREERLLLRRRDAAVPVRIEPKALRQPRTVRALDRITETLDGWQDLIREVKLVV